jgi:hypothetical protein
MILIIKTSPPAEMNERHLNHWFPLARPTTTIFLVKFKIARKKNRYNILWMRSLDTGVDNELQVEWVKNDVWERRTSWGGD